MCGGEGVEGERTRVGKKKRQFFNLRIYYIPTTMHDLEFDRHGLKNHSLQAAEGFLVTRGVRAEHDNTHDNTQRERERETRSTFLSSEQ